VDLDWAHNEERWQQYNEKSSEMDPSRLSRQRKTKEHMEEDNSWEGAEKRETELERSREQGTRSGGVAEYRRRPVQELKGKEEVVMPVAPV